MRTTVAKQFFLLIRDIPVIGLFLLLVGTLYRLIDVLLVLIQSRRMLRQDPPVVTLSSATVELPPGKKSLVFIFRGKKAPDAPVLNPVRTKLSMQIAGTDFWDTFAREKGATKANLGKFMLPLQLTDPILTTAIIQESGLASKEEDVHLRVDLGSYQLARKACIPRRRPPSCLSSDLRVCPLTFLPVLLPCLLPEHL